MTDVDLPLLEATLALLGAVNGHSSPAAPTAAGDATAWGIHATDMVGAILTTYDDALFVSIEEGVDVPRKAIFRIPFDAPDLDQLPLTGGRDLVDVITPVHEVKIYRNGSLLFWGPCVTRRATSKERVWEYTAYDPLWYLQHRYIGQANRFNWLGDDAESASGWNPVGSISIADDFDLYVKSPSSIELISGATGENYGWRRFTVTSGPIGLALFVTAWVHIDDFNAIAQDSNGLVLLRMGASGIGARANAQITAVTERGQWIRLSGVVNMPPFVTETIETRLYAIFGTSHFDAITVTIDESVSLIDVNSPGGAGWDQVQIAQQVVRYLSGSWPVGPSYRKSDLNIAVAGDPSGITKERTYQFFDHQPGYQNGSGSGVLDEWPKANDGFDYRIDLTPNSRTFRTYYPSVGVEWPPETIIFRYVYDAAAVAPSTDLTPPTIVAYEWDETIEGSATDVCELGGWGDGAGREEGGQSFDANMGDLTLELVETAPSDAPIDALNAIATGRAEQLVGVQQVPVFTIVEPKDPVTQEVLVPLIGVVRAGDVIWCFIDDGDLQLNDGLGGPVPVRVASVVIRGDDTLLVQVITN